MHSNLVVFCRNVRGGFGFDIFTESSGGRNVRVYLVSRRHFFPVRHQCHGRLLFDHSIQTVFYYVFPLKRGTTL